MSYEQIKFFGTIEDSKGSSKLHGEKSKVWAYLLGSDLATKNTFVLSREEILSSDSKSFTFPFNVLASYDNQNQLDSFILIKNHTDLINFVNEKPNESTFILSQPIKELEWYTFLGFENNVSIITSIYKEMVVALEVNHLHNYMEKLSNKEGLAYQISGVLPAKSSVLNFIPINADEKSSESMVNKPDLFGERLSTKHKYYTEFKKGFSTGKDRYNQLAKVLNFNTISFALPRILNIPSSVFAQGVLYGAFLQHSMKKIGMNQEDPEIWAKHKNIISLNNALFEDDDEAISGLYASPTACFPKEISAYLNFFNHFVNNSSLKFVLEKETRESATINNIKVIKNKFEDCTISFGLKYNFVQFRLLDNGAIRLQTSNLTVTKKILDKQGDILVDNFICNGLSTEKDIKSSILDASKIDMSKATHTSTANTNMKYFRIEVDGDVFKMDDGTPVLLVSELIKYIGGMI